MTETPDFRMACKSIAYSRYRWWFNDSVLRFSRFRSQLCIMAAP